MLTTAIMLAQLTGTFHLCPDGKTYGTVLGCSDITITNAPAPQCPPGYQLVADLAMQPKCARDVIDPIK